MATHVGRPGADGDPGCRHSSRTPGTQQYTPGAVTVANRGAADATSATTTSGGDTLPEPQDGPDGTVGATPAAAGGPPQAVDRAQVQRLFQQLRPVCVRIARLGQPQSAPRVAPSDGALASNSCADDWQALRSTLAGAAPAALAVRCAARKSLLRPLLRRAR